MGMQPYYDYGSSVAVDATESVAGFMLVFMLVYYLLIAAFWILYYVLYSMSTYSIAKRRGIHHPWLAWLPFGSEWILGSISDQYQYLAKGKVRNRRKVLLGLSVGASAVFLPMLLMVLATVVSEAAGMDSSEVLLGATVAVALLGCVIAAVLVIILAVFQWIALYDLFASSDPGNAVLYLVLSILLGVTLPFFVFACRNKDLGMPPRKQPQPVVTCIPESAEQTESYEE